MAKTIGKITFENGSFFIKHPDGTLEVAKVGAMLSEGDVIIGSSSNSNSNLIRVSLIDNSSEIQVVGSNEQLFDITLLSGEIPEDTVVPNSQVGDLLEQATNNQQDPNQNNEQATLTLAQIENLDAAAAGAGQTTTEPVGIVPLRLEDRTAGETNVVTDLRDAEETLAVIDDTVEADNRIDDVPTTGVNPTISLDDDTLSIDSIGNPLAVDFGQNGAGSVALTDITADTSLGLTSSVAGNVMTISQNGVAVMTITLNSAGGTYTYDVNQIAAISHPDATTEDNIDFTVNYVVTDIDGDTATGTFGIVVNDSVPALDIELTETTIPTLTTQDAQTEGVNVSDTASGSFATLFTLTQDMGADVDGTPATLSYALSLATGTTTSLTSAGEAITLSMNNGVVEGKVAGVDEPIFTVAVDASTGTVTLTQNGPIDHLTESDTDTNGLTDDNSVTNVGLSLTGAINLTASATITDEDGDQRTDSETIDISSAISFDDDVPTITVSGGTTIAEDAVDNVATTDVNESIVTGTWDNANAGADEAASTVVVIGTTEYALGTAIDTGKGTLTVNTNGTWTFDPVTGLDQDTVQSVTFSVKVTDNDGDVASDDHTITITDGTGPSIDPTANSITLTTDEADMATDDTETLTFTLGSDALESIAFGTDLTALVSDTNEVVGTDVVWTRTSDTVITGTIGGQTAITLTLTPNLTAGTASVKADIADNFDSVLGNNGTNTLSLGSVSVVATDIDGDIATGTVNVEVIDDVPTVNFTDAINNTTTPTVATGTWSETIGADNNSMTLGADVELNWVKVNNVLIPTTTFTFDNSSNTGSGTFVYDGTTYNFDLTLNNNGTYEVVAASLPQTIEINYNEFSSSIKASGPTDTYIVEYQDADTKDIYSAKIYAEVEGNSLSLVNYVNSTTTNIIPSTTVGSTINVSATGIGLGNNVLESYYKNGVYTSESLYFNPDNETNLITLNFTGTGANAFGSGDVIYIELTGVDGTVQTVLLDSVHGDFIVNSDNSLTPISNTYTGGNLSSYSVSLSNGESIDYVKVTTGFSGTTETNVKLAFSYSVSETVTFNEDLSMNFTATITDADNDQDSIDFDVQFNKVDLIPESTDKVFDMTLGDTKETVNVVITLDLSGSMDDDINDTTRLALAKDAIENMLNAYADNYIVNVKLVTFSDSGTSYDWILNDVDTAIATVNSLNTGVYTNYEAGVSATYSNYTEPTADKTVAYFISDGAPTSENNEGSDVWFNVGTDSESGWLDTSYKTAWNTFVDTYVDELNVIAVNSGTFSTTYLDALASAEQGNNTIVITDEYQLSNILVNLASEQISGNAYSTISGGNGVISIDAIEVNGTTYNASDYTSSNNTVTLNNWNGTLTFNFSNGAYTYVTSADKFTQDLEKSFKIFASDEDGDTTSFDVKINVDIDDTASTPTLDMNISDSTTVISDLTYPDRTISNGATYSQTISLGSAYANKTVTVSFDAQTGGNWNKSDTFKVYNGTISSANEVYSNKNDFTVNNKTFTVTLWNDPKNIDIK
ncbi:beta strand repeat-containing protein [Arcobacter ellisii]|uniref:von Willebrand factor type A (VWA) domain-containing protein n=1 Tax=Arcobacter ellisii TaxID=913109 RepID=A0A347UA70_9BACT|nr:DUF5801 repeats-in-toxin domain-containing protein [Arcobacter ellisii]AXX95748.1 von Willebrand factor type A (vWA) domain-containing protein [Arcobacter ellisii]RXI29145.1 hypothetical protein CP962_12235 [Arcobacter ellisii]